MARSPDADEVILKPPTLGPDTLRIIPLGGVGEVGRNMTAFEIGGKILLVDCGVLFPEENQPGVDLILPDFTPVEDRLDDVVALVLTHGHEDHIGAVPYLLRLREDIPLIGSQLTLAFVEAKLTEHNIRPLTLAVGSGTVERLGPFECEFMAVTHSIPDSLAVAIRTKAGTILHTGDFKMDQLPLDGRITDLRAFARLGEAGVDLLMVDSTNAEVPGFVATEREIGPVLDSVFGQATGLIVVACFSSHVHRVQQVLDAAAAHGRKVAFAGRSMIRNMTIAMDLGFLKAPPGTVVDLGTADSLPRDRIVFVSTGSQGEPMAALSRIANGDHKILVGPGDTVILASSLIPGNENSVYRVINGLTRLGAKVVHKGNARVHVSGHAAAGELLYALNIVRPRGVMPVHGEARHLVASGALAVSTGVPPERVVLAENGLVIDVTDGQAEIVGAVPVGQVYVDGSSVGELTEVELKDRRILGDEGFISVFAVVNARKRCIVAAPAIQARGMAESDDVFAEILPGLTTALENAMDAGAVDTHQMQQVMRRVLGRWVGSKLRKRPLIIPVVVEV
ncbi:MAG: ribonuclease J [Bifidobacteriaceae bacterium]|jgi:ribonuclease J|nr:ribonuclease J [Bifidobacteriaceae bacterium]